MGSIQFVHAAGQAHVLQGVPDDLDVACGPWSAKKPAVSMRRIGPKCCDIYYVGGPICAKKLCNDPKKLV